MTPYECPYTGKLAHPTRAGAAQHRADLVRKGDPGADRLDVYICSGHYHVGHRDTSRFDRMIRRALNRRPGWRR